MPKDKPLVGQKTDKTTQYDRDVYVTEEGDNVSELSVTVPVGDKWYNAPSIHNGVRYEEGEIVDMIKGGKIKPTSVHDSLEDALDAAQDRTDNIKYAKGGDTMINKKTMFAEGGMMDDSGESVNGVEVPVGSLKQEVADDVPARLSEGEFVVPADVVRFIGLEKLMAMRDKAKAGLQRMQEMGQVGNADQVADPDQLFNGEGEEDLSGFESEIDNILAEDQPQFANGGSVMKYENGGIVPSGELPEKIEKDYTKAPIKGFKMGKYINAQGEIKYIPTVNGKPLLPVPEGYQDESVVQAPVEVVEEETTEKAPPPQPTDTGGGGDSSFTTETGDAADAAPGAGISNTAIDAAATTLSISTNPVVEFFFPVISRVATAVANAVYDNQLDKMTAAQAAVTANNVVDTGMFTMAGVDGGISTVSNDASIQAQNEAVFGGYFNAQGDFVDTTNPDDTSDADMGYGNFGYGYSPSVDPGDADMGYGDFSYGSTSNTSTSADTTSSVDSTNDADMGYGDFSYGSVDSNPGTSSSSSSSNSSSSSWGGGWGGGGDGGGFGGGGGFGSMGGADGASVGGGGEARGGFISPETSAKRRASAKKGLASKRK